jgi:hypothetical protein
VYPVVVYLTYFVLPVVVSLPILLTLALTWKNPRRIVVFRRFNTPLEARRLRRIAARHLGRVGHVFTLADSQIRRSLFVRIPAFLGQLSFLQFRPRRVHDDRGLTRLERLLDQRWRLNINWLVSFRKIFPIATSDEYWQRSVGILLEKADMVVMDISSFTASMGWEIAECHHRELLSKTILLISREKADQSEAVLEQMAQAAGAGLERTAFAYGPKDVEQPDALRQRIADIVTHEGTSSWAIPRWQVFATMVTTLTVSLALAAVGVAVSAPYVFPELAGRYSPFRSQVLAAYRLSHSPDILSRLIADDRESTLTKLGEYASDRTSAMQDTAITALSDVGDERDIGLLIQVIGNRPLRPVRTDDDWFTRLVASWDPPEARALTHLVKRLGQPALRPLLQAMAVAPRMPFNGHLYDEFIHVQAKGAPPEVFEPLLAAPNQAGRFAAALELAPLKKDPRVVPILLEIACAANPQVGLYAQDLLSQWPHDVKGLDWWSRIDSYILANDVAAERAARLAFDASDSAYLVRTLEHVPDGVGQGLLKHLVERARSSDEAPTAARAHALLARASDVGPIIAVRS